MDVAEFPLVHTHILTQGKNSAITPRSYPAQVIPAPLPKAVMVLLLNYQG